MGMMPCVRMAVAAFVRVVVAGLVIVPRRLMSMSPMVILAVRVLLVSRDVGVDVLGLLGPLGLGSDWRKELR